MGNLHRPWKPFTSSDSWQFFDHRSRSRRTVRFSITSVRDRPSARWGRGDEWHLDFPNAVRHEALQFVGRHVAVLMLSMRLLSTSRLEADWSIGDAMDGHRFEQLFVKAPAERGGAVTLEGDHRL